MSSPNKVTVKPNTPMAKSYQLLLGQTNSMTKRLRENILNTLLTSKFQSLIFYSLNNAAAKGVNSAYFYLGMMYLEGLYVQKDQEKALDCYIKGAAKNNAYCYFELSRIYSEGIIVEKQPKLQYLYLKRSAEEGFVTA